MKIKLPLDLKKLQKKADRLFQRRRVLEEVDENGYAFCITFKSGRRAFYRQGLERCFLGREVREE